jgi:choline dehydrogenase-like flavoprotein
MGEPTYDGNGPGVSIATCQFNHGNPGVIGGGMLANEFIRIPAMFWRTNLPPDLPKWGLVNKHYMRENYTRFVRLASPVQEIPSPDCRVCVDPAVRDKYGIPVARLSGASHAETVRTADFIRAKAVQWLKASGAIRVWSYPSGMHMTAGQHQAGTCRMGNDPHTSVTDSWGRVHGHDNLYVVDASLHVTNGGFNPVLTIMALAFRCAAHITQTMP